MVECECKTVYGPCRNVRKERNMSILEVGTVETERDTAPTAVQAVVT